jgi:CubicO group peptidase (beta-lactamase class C family)
MVTSRPRLHDWDLPGAAIAVVKDGRVIVARGYGVLELGKPDRVDADTMFGAASLTKSFTAAAIASLVDDKVLAWDDPVRRHLPALELPDPYLTANVTIRDLLCHRTGIRSTNSAWYFTAITRPQLLAVIKNMPIAAPFRTRLVYSNVGYMIAGETAAVAAHTTWEDLITQRLISPLGLTRTTVDFLAAPAMKHVASGHALFGGVQRVAPREGTPRATTAAAGAVQSSAADLAAWMLFQLGDGSWAGRRIVSADGSSMSPAAEWTRTRSGARTTRSDQLVPPPRQHLAASTGRTCPSLSSRHGGRPSASTLGVTLIRGSSDPRLRAASKASRRRAPPPRSRAPGPTPARRTSSVDRSTRWPS